MNGKHLPTVFISYASSDQVLARALTKSLSESGISSWYDRSELRPGSIFADEINAGLEQADAMVVLLGPHSINSQFVRNEITHALFDDRLKDKLLPVLLGDVSTERLPWILSKFNALRIAAGADVEDAAKEVTQAIKHLLERSGERQ